MATFLLIIFLSFCLVGCGGGGRSMNTAAENATSVYQLNDRKYVIGYGEGSFAAHILRQELPNAKRKSYNDEITGYESVRQGKIDGYLFERTQMQLAINSGLDGVKLLSDNFKNASEIGVGISPVTKIPDFENKINRFIAQLKDNGILTDMVNRWLVNGDETMPDIAPVVNPQYHLRIGTTAVIPPYTYYKDNKVWGFDIELGKRFAAWLGADYEFKIYDYGGIISAALSGDIDCIMANLNKTPERAEKIHFSIPVHTSANTLMVRDGKSPKIDKTSVGISSLNDIRRPNIRIGMPVGSIFDKMVDEQFPRAEKLYYNNFSDIIEALLNDKIDASIFDEAAAIDVCRDVEGVDYIRQKVSQMDTGLCFPKTDRGRQLCDDFNAFWRNEIKKGAKEELFDKWIKGDESGKTLTVPKTVIGRPTVSVITHIYPPFSYIKDEKMVGYDIEVIYRWCEARGYNVIVSIYDSSAVIAALASDKGDVMCGDIAITEERKENITFSEPICNGGVVAVVKKNANLEKQNNNFTASKTLDDLRKSGIKIGMGTGTNFVDVCKKEFPQAEILYFNNYADMVMQIKQNKIDAVLVDSPSAVLLCRNIDGIEYIPEFVDNVDYAAAFPKTDKGRKLCGQLNEFLKRAKTDGTLAQLQDIWFGSDESRKKIAPLLEHSPNGTLHLAVDAVTEPFSYMSEQQVVGYDIAYITKFCREYGYGLKTVLVDFSAIMPGLATGAYDLAATGIAVTKERKESVLFSDPVYKGGTAAIVKAGSSNQSSVGLKQNKKGSSIGIFLKNLTLSFEKTFIREARWKLILSGIGVTVLVSIMSALLGTLLGFGICGMRLSKNKILDKTAIIYIRVMQGMPMVVLLMILFYVVFAKTGLNGVWVAVIGFGMNFAAYVSEMIRTGIIAVDKGQTEAALALGYTKPHAFFRIVLPQAAKHFLPVFQGEFVSLVKMTSVLGYIAVQDLTKAGDIIRSRTYEAFFPLITIAVIYFVIAWLLTRVIVVVQNNIDPQKRKKGHNNEDL